MTWEQINDWFDSFHDEYIEGRKPIRGRSFSGARIEIWNRDNVVIVVHDPYPRGSTEESRATDLVRNIFDSEHQKAFVEIDYARFQRIVRGEEPLTDKDWIWPDED